MQFYHFFINPPHLIFNYFMIYQIILIYLNLLFNYLVNLNHFDVNQFFMYVHIILQ